MATATLLRPSLVRNLHGVVLPAPGVSFEERIVPGNYGASNPAIGQYFSFATTFLSSGPRPLTLASFEKGGVGAVLEWAGSEGYVPAYLEDLLEVGVVYPDLQREAPIILPRFSGVRGHGDRLPYLGMDGAKRVIYFEWRDFCSDFPRSFLFVTESDK